MGLVFVVLRLRIENMIPFATFLSLEPVIIGLARHIISLVVDLEGCTHTVCAHTQRSAFAISSGNLSGTGEHESKKS